MKKITFVVVMLLVAVFTFSSAKNSAAFGSGPESIIKQSDLELSLRGYHMVMDIEDKVSSFRVVKRHKTQYNGSELVAIWGTYDANMRYRYSYPEMNIRSNALMPCLVYYNATFLKQSDGSYSLKFLRTNAVVPYSYEHFAKEKKEIMSGIASVAKSFSEKYK